MTQKDFRRRDVLVSAASALAAGLIPGAALAQSFPARPIQMVIPFGPGGATDIIFRIVGKKAESILGKPIVPLNVAGAMSTNGSRQVKNARPDGYTLLGTHDTIILAHASGVVDYGPEAFETVAMITNTPNIAAVKADAPWKTMRDYLNDVKAKPDQLTWSAAAGTDNYTFIGGIFDAAGMDIKRVRLVPYDDTASEVNALLGGHVQGINLNVAAGAQYVKAGQLRFIGVAHNSRLKGFEDVPTLKEQGIDFTHATNRGIFAPKGTPKPVLDQLEAAFRTAMQDPEILATLDRMGTSAQFLNQAEYRAYLDRTATLMKKLFPPKT